MSKDAVIGIGFLLTVIGLIFVLASATTVQTNTTTNSDSEFAKICLSGVVYWRGYKTLAPKFNPDATVELCRAAI